jgi:hypothetical protein
MPMLSILEYAAQHPARWHDLGPRDEPRQAAKLLVVRGVIEVRQPMNQFKLVHPKK